MYLEKLIELVVKLEEHIEQRIHHMSAQIQALTDAVTANTTATNAAVAALAAGGGTTNPADAAAVAAAVSQLGVNNAALTAAVSGGTTGGAFTSLGAITSSVDADAGTGPFILSGLDPAQFTVGMGPLVSAASVTAPLDPGTFMISASNTGAGTVTATSTDGWKPIAGHVLGKPGTVIPPVVKPPAGAASLLR